MGRHLGSSRRPLRASLFLGVVLVALTLVLSSSGYVNGGGVRGASTGTGPGATTTAASVPTLAWSHVAWPAGANASEAGIAVSRSGAAMWACAPVTSGAISIWTAPPPASMPSPAPPWQQAATLNPSTPESVRSCHPVIDQNDLHALAGVLEWGSGEAATLRSMSYFSADGVTWQQLPGDLDVMALASAGNRRYALLLDTTAPANQQASELVVSSDNLHTWRIIRPKGLAATDSFFTFWLNPAGTELLAASYDNTLWMTSNVGASWTRLSTPAMQTSLATWLPATNQWQLCGWAGTQTQETRCSGDLGRTWQAEPAFTATTTCSTCGKSGTPVSSTNTCVPNAIQLDGSLVAVCAIDNGSSQPGQGPQSVYRLAHGATTWTALGSAPGGFFALTDAGQLWCVDTAGQVSQAQLPA